MNSVDLNNISKINSTPDRDRTIADITLTDDGEKGLKTGYGKQRNPADLKAKIGFT